MALLPNGNTGTIPAPYNHNHPPVVGLFSLFYWSI